MDRESLRRLREVTIRQISQPDDGITRLVLGGDNIAHFAGALPAAWVKVFFTASVQAEGPGRAYTIRSIDRHNQTLTIDIVRHADGAAMRWLPLARCGDRIRIAGPRDGFEPDGVKTMLLFGDETALPAIASIVEQLDNQTHVHLILLLRSPFRATLPAVRCRLDLCQLQTGTDDLASHVFDYLARHPVDRVWGAGEQRDVINIRKTLLRNGRQRSHTDITAYWKQGEADHHDR
ncbi:hypothetical protein BL250_10670 [Erwinia sp. OLTSP20]|uniref:siderophore-interacting protein n=1 Tax=unclassified Erwinia TaxID=2622719 RepID=UPI000C19678C|nr:MULTISPECIES: siderophore-interacting protein [unclassified Erwinia]PIJ50143.1 hypothetical protein BV501_09895 [Erwinia sp. OAMSP11]PIJ81111.1 hypothetical protein BLD47_09840 [Erwinia sp. OLCASP19]PIJ86156.1 hypothetical protein BLD49_08955 [Erwinia sp. OLMDSP33]PIJ89675.1 hypothetical protein BL249_15500 [Erwinia sp. OLFS4]PIJ92279.1 hypothetical protein BL250_10670 [Erwinia sp. OLTSP20]